MLADDWVSLTEKNLTQLTASFPEVFVKNKKLPATGFDRWKINQLGVWKNIFMD